MPTALNLIPQLFRWRQWPKNALLFAGFVFAGRLRAPDGNTVLANEILRVLLAFICFCALSSAIYIINDWHDAPQDRQHPIKKLRPIAAGLLGRTTVFLSLATLLVIATLCGLLMVQLNAASLTFLWVAAAYFVLFLVYSFFLKHEVILDVLCVAIGFVLRVVAGCLAIAVTISPWILLCTFNLALFVVLCKRRAECSAAGENLQTRKVLSQYSLPMLDAMIPTCCALAIISYSLYTFTASHIDTLGMSFQGEPLLMATIPIVVYSVFRYWYLALNTHVGEAPEKMLTDARLVLAALAWSFIVIFLTVLTKI